MVGRQKPEEDHFCERQDGECGGLGPPSDFPLQGEPPTYKTHLYNHSLITKALFS